ncbi:hypothetical protein GGF50DRAFT_112714 [Schizophyllum commune]
MASIFPVVFWLVIVVVLMACAALFTPKGPQQCCAHKHHASVGVLLPYVDDHVHGAATPFDFTNKVGVAGGLSERDSMDGDCIRTIPAVLLSPVFNDLAQPDPCHLFLA